MDWLQELFTRQLEHVIAKTVERALQNLIAKQTQNQVNLTKEAYA